MASSSTAISSSPERRRALIAAALSSTPVNSDAVDVEMVDTNAGKRKAASSEAEPEEDDEQPVQRVRVVSLSM